MDAGFIFGGLRGSGGRCGKRPRGQKVRVLVDGLPAQTKGVWCNGCTTNSSDHGGGMASAGELTPVRTNE